MQLVDHVCHHCHYHSTVIASLFVLRVLASHDMTVKLRKRPKICPKIEKPQALTNIDAWNMMSRERALRKRYSNHYVSKGIHGHVGMCVCVCAIGVGEGKE